MRVEALQLVGPFTGTVAEGNNMKNSLNSPATADYKTLGARA